MLPSPSWSACNQPHIPCHAQTLPTKESLADDAQQTAAVALTQHHTGCVRQLPAPFGAAPHSKTAATQPHPMSHHDGAQQGRKQRHHNHGALSQLDRATMLQQMRTGPTELVEPSAGTAFALAAAIKSLRSSSERISWPSAPKTDLISSGVTKPLSSLSNTLNAAMSSSSVSSTVLRSSTTMRWSLVQSVNWLGGE